MKLEQVAVSEIRGPAFNIRAETSTWDDDLFESIKTHGLKQPILLRPSKRGFEIVAGMRRFEAVKKLKLKTIPAVVEDLDDKTSYEIMLAENIQRRQLSPLEEAKAFRDYLDKYSESINALARRINKSRSYIVQRLFMIDWMKELPAKVRNEVKEELGAENITTSHIEAVSKIREPEKVRKVVDAIRKEKLNVPQTEEVVELVERRAVPVERAVQTVKIMERAREAASEVAEDLKDALVKADRDIKEIEGSDKRRLLENYMFLGSIVKSLEGNSIFCIAHKNEKPSLKWACGTPVTETHEGARRKLGLGT